MVFVITDILIIGKLGHDIVLPGDEIWSKFVAGHGYDNQVESMHPIFYAFGPAFPRNLLAESFRDVDLYPLMSYILGLEQRPTNGSLNNVKHILLDFTKDKFSIFSGKKKHCSLLFIIFI